MSLAEKLELSIKVRDPQGGGAAWRGCVRTQVSFISAGSGRHSLWHSLTAGEGGRTVRKLGAPGRRSSFQSFIIFSITRLSLQGGKSQLLAEDPLKVLLFSTLPPAQAAGCWAKDTSLFIPVRQRRALNTVGLDFSVSNPGCAAC